MIYLLNTYFIQCLLLLKIINYSVKLVVTVIKNIIKKIMISRVNIEFIM